MMTNDYQNFVSMLTNCVAVSFTSNAVNDAIRLVSVRQEDIVFAFVFNGEGDLLEIRPYTKE